MQWESRPQGRRWWEHAMNKKQKLNNKKNGKKNEEKKEKKGGKLSNKKNLKM